MNINSFYNKAKKLGKKDLTNVQEMVMNLEKLGYMNLIKNKFERISNV